MTGSSFCPTKVVNVIDCRQPSCTGIFTCQFILMKRNLLTYSLLLGLVGVVVLPFLLALHPAVGGFLHKQLAYSFIGAELTDGCTTDHERTMAVMAYVYLHETHLSDWSLAEDRDVLHDLVRNVGWCDQQSNAMAHLLLPLGIDARMVMFPCHTFAEVDMGGRPMLFDPTYNNHFFIQDAADSIASLDDLLHRPPKLMTRHGQDMEGYERKDVLTCGNPVQWKWLSSSISGGRKLLSGLIGTYFAIGGKPFAQTFNRWYLFIHPNGMNPLFDARCLHLFGQQEKAIAAYTEDGSLAARFFLFQALVEEGRYDEALLAMDTFHEFASDHRGADYYYSEVMEDYTAKLQSLQGGELRLLFNLDSEGLQELFQFLERLQ